MDFETAFDPALPQQYGVPRIQICEIFYDNVRVILHYAKIDEWKVGLGRMHEETASFSDQNTHSKDSDQTARMRRMIWIFARRKDQVRFLKLQLKCCIHSNR